MESPAVLTSLSCTRCTRSSPLFRLDSAIPFLCSRRRVRGCGLLALLTAMTEAFCLELSFLVNRVGASQAVDSLPRIQVKP
jgi:hypothetical protein